jgi:glycosyltransferase involved in cell wall biosynthesis
VFSVSVVIPAYNASRYISGAIQSVISQTVAISEIIVVDDGSTDGTSLLVKNYEAQGVKYIFQENGGPSKARNMGIKKSFGEFIAFLDFDDEWLPDKIEKQVGYMIQNPDVGLTTCGRHNVKQDGSIISTCIPKINHLNSKDLVQELACSNIIGGGSAVVIRRSVINKSGLFNESLHVSEDCDMWLRIASSFRMACIEMPLYLYRVLPAFIEMLFDNHTISKSIFLKSSAYKYFSAAMAYHHEGNRFKAIECVLVSLYKAPLYIGSTFNVLVTLFKMIVGKVVLQKSLETINKFRNITGSRWG